MKNIGIIRVNIMEAILILQLKLGREKLSK
jgi:hypothetical protein